MIIKFIEGAIEGFILVNKARKYRKILVSRYNSIYYKKPIKVKKVKPIKSGRNIPYSKNPPMPKSVCKTVQIPPPINTAKGREDYLSNYWNYNNRLMASTEFELDKLSIKHKISKAYDGGFVVELFIDNLKEIFTFTDYKNYVSIHEQIIAMARDLKDNYLKSTISEYRKYYNCNWLSSDFRSWYTRNMLLKFILKSKISDDYIYFRIEDDYNIIYERSFPKAHFEHFRRRNEEILINELKEQFLNYLKHMKLITTKDYLLLIDEEAEIKKNDYLYDKLTSHYAGIHQHSGVEYENGNAPNIIQCKSVTTAPINCSSKVIAYYPLTKEAKELDLPLLPNPFKSYRVGRKQKRAILDENGIEVVIFKTGNENEAQRYCDYLNGKYFSLEDVKKAIEMGREYDIDKAMRLELAFKYSSEEIIQSLSTQQLPKEFIVETYGCDGGCGICDNSCNMLKTITNLESKIELVGTYKY